MKNLISIIKSDITSLEVEAIVNAANNSLLGGGGVDGAIHQKAGPQLLSECLLLNGCNTGEAKITKAYKLPSKYVIHTVGPVWEGGDYEEVELLTNCYVNSLDLAVTHQVESIAFPCISTGIYGFPNDLAAKIAYNIVQDYLVTHVLQIKVTFCCFLEKDYELYKQCYFN